MQSTDHPQNNFDFLRLAAALCVVWSHQFALYGLREPEVARAHSLGGFGVLIFFSISGFLVAQSWQADPHLWRFAAKRLLRVWPGLAVAVTLVALLLGPWVSDLSMWEYLTHPQLREYFQNLQFNTRDRLPLSFEGNALPLAVNGPLWTIPLELKCYLLLMVLGVFGLLRRWRWVLLGTTLALAFAYCALDRRGAGWGSTFYWLAKRDFLVEFGLFFFAGSALHAFRVHQSPRKAAVVLGVALLLAGAAMAMDRPLFALWLAVPAAVIVIGNASTPILRRAGRFGDLSYGVYIYAFPVQQTMIWLLKDRLPWAGVLALALAVTFALAFASWHLVEKRALRLKPRSGGRPFALQQEAGART